MKLRFSERDIHFWKKEYLEVISSEKLILEEELINNIAPTTHDRGYLTKDALNKLCLWKSPRSTAYILKNDDIFIQEITEFSLRTSNMRASIEVLTLLDGVRWPMASAILHFFHNDRFPVLDYRALWSIQVDVPKFYNYDFWHDYTAYCRRLSDDMGLSMRDIDRALWRYSKSHQSD